MVLRILILIAVACGTQATLIAHAEEAVSVNDVFGRFGYTTERVPGQSCVVKMMIDRKKFIGAVPELKAMDLLNPEYVTQTRMNVEPTALAMAFSLQMAPAVVKDVYDEDAKADRCKFVQAITTEDDYGNDKVGTLFTFEFTRAIYKKVNWDKFLSQNLPKVAIKFIPGPAVEEAVREREQFGD
jgi:hypothetical protein